MKSYKGRAPKPITQIAPSLRHFNVWFHSFPLLTLTDNYAVKSPRVLTQCNTNMNVKHANSTITKLFNDDDSGGF